MGVWLAIFPNLLHVDGLFFQPRQLFILHTAHACVFFVIIYYAVHHTHSNLLETKTKKKWILSLFLG